jgi:hypothetical protein
MHASHSYLCIFILLRLVLLLLLRCRFRWHVHVPIYFPSLGVEHGMPFRDPLLGKSAYPRKERRRTGGKRERENIEEELQEWEQSEYLLRVDTKHRIIIILKKLIKMKIINQKYSGVNE